MTNKQGTEWESEIVNNVKKDLSAVSDRYPKRAQIGEPDLFMQFHAHAGTIKHTRVLPALFWKRLVGKKGNGPRRPDGVRRVVVIPAEDYLYLLERASFHEALRGVGIKVLVQAKWTTNLNVTKVLGELVDWMKSHGTPA